MDPPLVLEEVVEEKKPIVELPTKSSMEILSELFESFDAEPPLIIKKEKSDTPTKKVKKSKKKHKHNHKKHKKKDKKKKRSRSGSSDKSEIDLAEILIKQEKESSEKKIKIEGTNLSIPIKTDNDDVKNDNVVDNNKNGIEKKIEIKIKTTNLHGNEEGELSHTDESDNGGKSKKRKHKSDHDKSKKKKKRSRSREKKIEENDLRNKLMSRRSKSRERRSNSRDRHKYNDIYKSKDKDDYYRDNRDKYRDKDDFYKIRDRQRERSRERRSRDRDKYRDSDYKSKKKDNPFYRDDDGDKDKKYSRDKYRSSFERERDKEKRHRDRSDSRESSYIDKKKLLEIARRNAIQMMKSGNLPGALTLGPQAQEKVIAAIKAGGKTIEELTDFCKTLSRKEELGDLSSNPDENGSDSDNDVPFHHPFQIKDRPTSITMNIKNSVPLPLKTTQERSSELRMQFPVSSGQLHRKTENEWVPVSPKKPENVTSTSPVKDTISTEPLAIEAPPVVTPLPPVVSPLSTAVVPVTAPGPQIFPTQTNNSAVDIGSIVSERLAAMRRLQENPNDVEALGKMYKSNKEMQTWAASKQQPGQFTGTTGAQILSQAELSSGYQAWAKKDQLQSATPVSGGMGMHLLQKMGWKPGEGLGKEKSGALEPLLLEVKLDKKGLVANEEQRKKKKQPQGWNPKTLQSKHPVSLLGEYASKKKLGAPQYNLCFECGPDHKKNFLFEVVLNGMQYKPNVASPNKKEAKAMAATVCLQHLGLLPATPPVLPPNNT